MSARPRRPSPRHPSPRHQHRRVLVAFLTLVTALVGLTVAARPAPAQDGGESGQPVAVFEGRGIGHGLGLPLDGAQVMARAGATVDDVVERFFPGTGRGDAGGLVRMQVAVRDDPAEGIVVELPDGGVVRDGRATPVAPSFPISVPAGGRVKITVDGEFSRAEVLDERSASGTNILEVGPAGEPESAGESPVDESAEPTQPPAPEPRPDAADGEEPDFPGLGGSPNTLWIEPRGGGALVVPPADGAEPRAVHGLFEVVVEGGQLHLVDELDVEAYLRGLGLSLPDDTELERVALEAAVVTARTYALRAASAEPRIGRFHVFADQRSLPWVGPDEAPAGLEAAVAATRGRVIEHDGRPAAALMSVSAGGVTGVPSELYGSAAPDAPYLQAVEYEPTSEFRWRVDIPLAEVAAALGFEGEALTVAAGRQGASGRPTTLVVRDESTELEVEADRFHEALRLPSTLFEVGVETRPDPVGERAAAPPFQELPGEPLEIAPAAAGGSDAGRASPGDGLAPPYVLAAGAALALSVSILGVAHLQRAVRRQRERRATRRRHPVSRLPGTATAAGEAAEFSPAESSPAESSPAEEAAPAVALTPAAAGRPDGDSDDEPPPAFDEPIWENEPTWLRDLGRPEGIDPKQVVIPEPPDRDAAEPTGQPTDEPDDEQVPPTRPLREVLGWDDAPDWLDDD